MEINTKAMVDDEGRRSGGSHEVECIRKRVGSARIKLIAVRGTTSFAHGTTGYDFSFVSPSPFDF